LEQGVQGIVPFALRDYFNFVMSCSAASTYSERMKLYIKYMVSIRCKMIVKEELKKLGLHYVTVTLGEVDVMENITKQKREKLKTALLKSGLELMDDKKAMLIEKIKNVIVEMIHYSDELPKIKFSDYLSEKLKYDYTYLSNLFSETEGTTIEHFILLHKIERVKELIIYDELNLTEIADKLHYSSVGHLSNQFKKITGLTPSFFKSLKHKKRITLENV
jgi:AraC-like DNA-binding protein